MQDRSFVCLHFHLDDQGQLHPCTTAPAANNAHGGSSGEAEAQRFTVEQSNVQLGVMVRKGVGGTCPLRCDGPPAVPPCMIRASAAGRVCAAAWTDA